MIKRRDLSHFDTGRRAMQAISPIATATAARARATRPSPGAVETIPPREPRALIPIRPVVAGAPAPALRRYPLAGFLAHLIAIRERAPQTRRRGRATPGEATAAYATAQRMSAPVPRYRKSA
jgi:hypothetical protein